MEEIAGMLITIIIASGVLGGAYIYFKNKLKYVATTIIYLGELLNYMHVALEDDKITKAEIIEIVAQMERLSEHIHDIVRGGK